MPKIDPLYAALRKVIKAEIDQSRHASHEGCVERDNAWRTLQQVTADINRRIMLAHTHSSPQESGH
jgi:hypothetical protein